MDEIHNHYPPIIEEIVKKALQKDNTQRYQSCMDFAYDLRVALRGLVNSSPVEKVEDIIDLVHHTPFFHNFTREQLSALGLASNITKAHRGETIVTEGEIDDTFYVLLKGTAKIIKGNTDIAFIKSGECFGEMAYIAGQARIATVVAQTDSILMKISATLLDKAPESIQLLFFKNFAKTLSYRLSQGSGKMPK